MPVTSVVDETEREPASELPSIQKYAISSYGADYPLDTLFVRLTSARDASESDIYIPDFQRGYVWTKAQADRFIESLLLGLPVPGIFLYRDEEDGRLLIVDGAQRLRTIRFFMGGAFDNRPYILGERVHPDFRGKSYKTLDPIDKRDFDNSIIHATIIKQEDPKNDRTSMYYIFDRLNTGGTPAQPQEVRNAIYHGPITDLLAEMNLNESWRNIFGQVSPRFKDQELILRFLALYTDGDSYGQRYATMKDFLTLFMASNRNVKRSATKFRNAFEQTVKLAFEALGRRAFRTTGGLNAALYDAVMVGLARRLAKSDASPPSPEKVQRIYESLLTDAAFTKATRTGTSQELNVRTRLEMSIAAFARA